MVISLTASVPQDGVFFAGERFSCTITFTNEPDRIKSSPSRMKTSISTDSFKKAPSTDNIPNYGLNGMTRTLSLSTEFPQVQTIQRSLPEPIPEEEQKPPLPSPDKIAPESGGKVNLSLGIQTHRTIQRQSSVGVEDMMTEDGIDGQSISTPLSINTSTSNQSLAWCFAQIVGQFVIDSNYIKASSFEPLQQKVMYKTPGSNTRSVGGGGSMGSTITHHENSAKPVANALPLYNTPPSILFCDEELLVGESKSFVYEILLPQVLPPSHRGKVIKFQYKLLIGIQKNITSKVTQMVSIPFRFLNRTNADGSRPVYEIMNPVIHIKDQAKVSVLNPNMVHQPSPFRIYN